MDKMPYSFILNKDTLEVINNTNIDTNDQFVFLYVINNMYGVVKKEILNIKLKANSNTIIPFNIVFSDIKNSPYFICFYSLYKNDVISYKEYLIKEETKLTYHEALGSIDSDEFYQKYKINFENGNIININDYLDSEITTSFPFLDFENKTTDKSIEYKNELIEKIIYRTKDNRLSLRLTVNTKNNTFDSIGFKFKIKNEFNKVIYYGKGPMDLYNRSLKLGITNTYTKSINQVNSITDCRIFTIINSNNHGLRIEYADTPFIVRRINDYIYIELINNNDLIYENSEYSFEILIDTL